MCQSTLFPPPPNFFKVSWSKNGLTFIPFGFQFPNKPLPNIVESEESWEIPETKLRHLDTSDPKDAQSEIVLRLWNFQDTIPDELLKRNVSGYVCLWYKSKNAKK